MSNVPPASAVNEWFPPERQTLYIENLLEKKAPRLTRKQATYFVRLWGYGCLKDSSQQLPIKTLSRTVKKFSCSHSEAAALFYCDRPEGGSERAAGMMLKTLAQKGLVNLDARGKESTVITLQILEGFLLKEVGSYGAQCEVDTFNADEDATFIANFLVETYPWVYLLPKEPEIAIYNTLQQWAAQHPSGLRVLRKSADREPVGFATLFPTHAESRGKFFKSPRDSLYLCISKSDDPIKLAGSASLFSNSHRR